MVVGSVVLYEGRYRVDVAGIHTLHAGSAAEWWGRMVQVQYPADHYGDKKKHVSC